MAWFYFNLFINDRLLTEKNFNKFGFITSKYNNDQQVIRKRTENVFLCDSLVGMTEMYFQKNKYRN